MVGAQFNDAVSGLTADRKNGLRNPYIVVVILLVERHRSEPAHDAHKELLGSGLSVASCDGNESAAELLPLVPHKIKEGFCRVLDKDDRAPCIPARGFPSFLAETPAAGLHVRVTHKSMPVEVRTDQRDKKLTLLY